MNDWKTYRETRKLAQQIAKTRGGAHKDDNWERPLCKNFNYIGAIGEIYVGYLYDWQVDKKARKYGDRGIDFTVLCKEKFITIDVKTSSLIDGMRVEEYKAAADVFFFCYYNKEVDWVELVGWITRSEVIKYKPYDTGRGIINHFVPVHDMCKMDKIALKRLRPIVKMPEHGVPNG